MRWKGERKDDMGYPPIRADKADRPRCRFGAATRGLAALVTLICLGMSAAWAGVPLKVSDYGDLQSAIDAAQVDDSVIVDIDTPGALLNKRLTIRGIPGQGTGGVITGAIVTQSPLHVGLKLTAEASGSQLLNLKIDASTGIASGGLFLGADPATDVEVSGCEIESGIGIFLTGVEGWNIEHNDVVIDDTSDFNCVGGVYLWESGDSSVRHNKISASVATPYAPLISGGVVVLGGGTNIEIVQNEISVNPAPGNTVQIFEAVVLSVLVGAQGASMSNVTVALNNFVGTDHVEGNFALVYIGTVDAGTDLTGLGAFDAYSWFPSPPAILTIGGNLDATTGHHPNRGELSASDLPAVDLLNP